MRCTGCTLLITWPRPDPIALARLYEQESYYEARGLGGAVGAAWLERACGILKELKVNPRSVLDFGAGVGHLVYALREMGIAAEGVETSSVARLAARRLYGLELRSELPPDSGGQFELVTLIHSLEHVDDPVSTLREVATLLRPEGLLFIEVPHAGSIEMWRPRMRTRILDLPHHLHHFVPRTLCRVAERAGFRVVEVHLSNPSFVEWALGVRAGWKHALARPLVEGVGRLPGRASDQARRHSIWTQRVVPWVRNNFPGYRFQLVATKVS